MAGFVGDTTGAVGWTVVCGVGAMRGVVRVGDTLGTRMGVAIGVGMGTSVG